MSRTPSLVAESFMGKFARALDEYDHMPSLKLDASEDAEVALCEEVSDQELASLLNEEWDPNPKLAERAEQTRSQLLARRTGTVETSGSESSNVSTRPIVMDTVAESTEERSKAVTSGRRAPPPHVASMITHASRTIARTGGPGHTFGALPRVSPSGTMAHHAPRVATTSRPLPSGSGATGGTMSSATSGRSCPTSRPASARAASVQPERRPLPTFGANAKGGALPYRPPSQQTVRKPHQPPFACVSCCGEPFEDYCCKRHHPDDTVVCCEAHDPIAQARLAKAMAKSAMGGRVGAGKGPAFSMGVPKGPRRMAIGDVPMPAPRSRAVPVS